MKTSLISLFSLATIFTGVFSAPTAKAVPVKRAGDPTGIISSLYSTVQAYTGSINATTASIDSGSTAAENATAEANIKSAIASINSAIVSANIQVTSLSKKSLDKRQDTTELATLVEDLILDISGALNNVIAQFGLTTTLSFLGPLVSSLSGLLASLEVVVNDLLAVVQELLDGLLTGLSLGLAGLTL
ncbi:hypothetical protein MMC08_003012 [Hypocenomyce scalaris]|nr:hypothetical protein [Hypocenomyce scalaris]